MKTKRFGWSLILPMAICMLVMSAFTINGTQERVKGNGNIKEEKRDASAFNSIGSSGEFNINITPGSTPSIEVIADDNLLPYIITDIEGGELKVHVKKGYDIKPTKSIVVNVTMAEVKSLAASGSGGFYSKGSLKGDKVELAISGSTVADLDINASKLEVGISGSTHVNLKGTIPSVEYGISGSANIKAFDLVSDNVEVGVSGSGDLSVYAQKKLSVSVSGSGKVRYKGSPQINQHSSGSASITKAD